MSLKPELIDADFEQVYPKHWNSWSLVGYVLAMVCFQSNVLELLALLLCAIGLATFDRVNEKGQWMAPLGLILALYWFGTMIASGTG